MKDIRWFKIPHMVPALIAGAVLLGAGIVLVGCGTVAVPVAHEIAVSDAAKAGISAADRAALDSGDIKTIRDRYSAVPRESLSVEQLSLLCDALLKYSEITEATACLADYETRINNGQGNRDKAVVQQMLWGKRGLLALAAGKPQEALQAVLNVRDPNLLEDAQGKLLEGHDFGSLYVAGLADTRLGNTGDALKIADKLSRQLDMAPVFFAASLYAVLGKPQQALDLLNDPERHLLLRNYGLGAGTNFFGSKIDAVPFRLAIFDEFSFGWLGKNSFAPAANVYVEYLAARCLLDLNRNAEAQAHYDAILNFPYIEAYRDVHWHALYDRGQLALRAADTARARELLEKSVNVIEAVRGSLSDQQGRIAFVEDKQAVYASLETLLIRQGDIETALEYAERSKSRALVDLLSARRLGVSPAASALVASLDRAEAEFEAASNPDTYRASLQAVDEARAQIRARAPDLVPLVTVAPTKAADIKARIGADEAAIEFVETGPGLRAFVIQHGRVSEYELPADGLANRINRFQTALRGSLGDETLQLGGDLYKTLFAAPLRDVTAKQLTIVPAGSLYHIAFAALRDGQHYMVERYALRVAPNLSVLTLARRPSTGVGGIVIGNNDKDGPAPLHTAEDEARQVAALSPGSKLLIGSDATLEAVSRNASGHRFLHFAGHGEWDQDDPLQSNLVFASVGGKPQFLTAADLFVMKLDVDLAVLSGCATGRVDVQTGDDVMGLLRGFLYAGPATVVASLWDVDDSSTHDLMAAYYKAYFSGLSPVDALRAAQLRLIADKRYSPSSWAAFFVTSVESST